MKKRHNKPSTADVPVTQAEIEGNIGNFALLRGRYDQALDYLERSRRRYEFLGMPHQSALAEREIADAYLELESGPGSALRFMLALPALSRRSDCAQTKHAHSHLAGVPSCCWATIEKRLSSLKRARELYQAEGNKVGEALVALTQAQLHHAHGNDESAYRLAVQAEADLSRLVAGIRYCWLAGCARISNEHSVHA